MPSGSLQMTLTSPAVAGGLAEAFGRIDEAVSTKREP
jgi:hypothetical protein